MKHVAGVAHSASTRITIVAFSRVHAPRFVASAAELIRIRAVIKAPQLEHPAVGIVGRFGGQEMMRVTLYITIVSVYNFGVAFSANFSSQSALAAQSDKVSVAQPPFSPSFQRIRETRG
jgi:hypothetical protein